MKGKKIEIAMVAVIALAIVGALGLVLVLDNEGENIDGAENQQQILEDENSGEASSDPSLSDDEGPASSTELPGIDLEYGEEEDQSEVSPIDNDVEAPDEPPPSIDEPEGPDMDPGSDTEGNDDPLEDPAIIPEENEEVSEDEIPIDNEDPEDEEVSGLSDIEIEGLIFMREEEKLARDVYSYLYDLWGQKTFGNIRDSEQKHMDSIKGLLDQFSLEDPVGDDEPGEFENQDLLDLYNDLIESGEVSLVDALMVGAAIEEIDILDLQEYLSETDDPDIIRVYENLLKGSENHLNSFVNVLSKKGVEYEPQYLSQEEYDRIVN